MELPTNRSRRDFIKSIGVVSLAPWLGACESPHPLSIAGHVWPGYEFVFMAQDLGWVDSSRIHLVKTDNAIQSMQLLRQGKVDGGMFTLDEVLRMHCSGIHLKVVLIFNVSLGADVVVSRPEIKNLNQLKGQTIGLEKGAVGELVLQELLAQANLTVEDINKIHIQTTDHLQAWMDPSLDVLISYEPTATQILNRDGHRLFDSRQMPDVIFDVLAVRADVMDTKSTALRTLINQHFRGFHHFRTNPMDASHRIAKRIELSPEQIIGLYRGLVLPDEMANYGYLSKQDQRLSEAVMKTLNILNMHPESGKPCQIESLFDNHFIPKDRL
jgi:NitT/TauT family transport system substrate-binding protein